MAIMNPKTALENETISDFGGLCDHAGLTSNGAMDMRNFRILSDGTLEKRCGVSMRYALGAPIRGLWEGTVSGETYLFAVSGNRIFRKGQKDANPTAIYTLPTSEGAEDYVCERLSNVTDSAENFAAVVLGCTHFIYFTDIFRRLIPDRPIFNGISGTASHVIRTLGLSSITLDTRNRADAIMRSTEFFISGKKADEGKMTGFQNGLELLGRI